MSEVTKQDLIDMEHRMIEVTRGVETTLLTEFQKWASPLEMRMKTHKVALHALNLEQEYLSDRLTKLERHAQQ